MAEPLSSRRGWVDGREYERCPVFMILRLQGICGRSGDGQSNVDKTAVVRMISPREAAVLKAVLNMSRRETAFVVMIAVDKWRPGVGCVGFGIVCSNGVGKVISFDESEFWESGGLWSHLPSCGMEVVKST